MTRFSSLLDRVLYRQPFEGGNARRYAGTQRPAFGDLDDRLIDDLQLDRATSLLDLGSGPGTFAARAASRHPHLRVIAVEPSRDFARAQPGLTVVRAVGESLPLADHSIDVALCLSSIRHVRDRAATLRELRRVAARLVIVELDPEADRTRVDTHARAISSPLMRATFGPLIARTAPHAEVFVRLARDAGWSLLARRADRVQPVYILELA